MNYVTDFYRSANIQLLKDIYLYRSASSCYYWVAMMMTSFSIAVHSIMGQFEALISCHDFLNSITARTKNSQFFCYHPSHSLRSDDDLWRRSDISAAASAAHRLLRATWDALGKVSAIASRSAFLSLCLKCIKTRFSFLYYLFFFCFVLFYAFFCRLTLLLLLLRRLSIMEGFSRGHSGE